MNWRSDIILNDNTGMKGLFDQYKEGGPYAGDPIEIKTVAAAFSAQIKPKDDRLPAVSFGFGNARARDGGVIGDDSGLFFINVYATVNPTADKTIIERAGDMYQCVQEVTLALRAYSNDDVSIQNARIATMRTPETKLSTKDYMLFVIEIQYEEILDE